MRAVGDFGEVLAIMLCRLAGVELQAVDQKARLQHLNRSEMLAASVLAAFEELRTAPYGEAQRTRGLETANLVRRCFELAIWYFRFRTGDRELIPFVRAEPAELHTLGGKVALLEQALPQLQRDFALRTLPEPMTASEREWLSSAASEVAAGPSEQMRFAPTAERLLAEAGWEIAERNQDAKAHRSLGSVVVNPRSTDGRRADYLLLVGGRAVGLVESIGDGADPGAAMERAETLAGAFSHTSPWPVWRSPLPYQYVSDGQQLIFRDANDPDPRARLVSGFHQPATMARWLREAEADSEAPTYSARLALRVPPLELATGPSAARALRASQRAAIDSIEKALRAGQRRALVQCHLACRLIML
jgi:type I restriction enzyme R subunit